MISFPKNAEAFEQSIYSNIKSYFKPKEKTSLNLHKRPLKLNYNIIFIVSSFKRNVQKKKKRKGIE